jgi:hypothetical protein
MTNFFDRFKPGSGSGDNKKKSSSNNNTNPLSNLFGGGGTTSFSGTGQSLGGNVKPGIVIPITLSEIGPLGIKIEKSSTNTAIVSLVVENTQAAAANIQRGDILCFANTNGTEEIDYDMFLELARSTQRPLCFEIRRIVAPSSSKSKNTTSSNNSNKINASTELSAEAFARKQAMIAAAEKREKDHQKKYNTTKSSSNNKPALKPILSTAEKNRLEQERQQRVLDEQASNVNSEFVQKAKHIEQQTASQLGYNPYAAQSVSAGQARTAVATTTHGTIQSTTTTTATNNSSSNMPAPGVVSAPTTSSLQPIHKETKNNKNKNSSTIQQLPSMEFQHAFETTVTSTSDHNTVMNSIGILRKLIINATTKGQEDTNNTTMDDNSKYRKIRFMTNPKIRSHVTDIPGAIDLLLSVGFQIHEEIIIDDNVDTSTTESVLLYPPNTPGPLWLPTALQQMEQYTQSSK